MRNIIIIILLLNSLPGLGQSKKLAVTVILFDSNLPNGKKMVQDTLMNDKEIDTAATSVDMYFTKKYFHMPYYVPTDGIYKNEAKNSECDMKLYPNTVKCYRYDSKDRVIKMNVSASGTMNNFTYQYNSKDQITGINDIGARYQLNYNSDGRLSELIYFYGEIITKRLMFSYR